MEIERKESTGSIKLTQKNMIKELLEEYDMTECRKCCTPLDPGMKFKNCLDCSNCEKVDMKNYQSLIGSLMYVGICTRPDIIHSVSKLAQFNKNPHQEHLAGAKHILRYLRNTINYALHFRSLGKQLLGFADADWAGSCDDRKSYTGYVFLLAGSSISYESKKQPTVALSTAEAEYMAISSAAKEIIYLRNLLVELGFGRCVKQATTLFGDNISAQQLVRNPVFHARSKHIDIKVHHVREIYQKGHISLKYVSSVENTADIFTKVLMKSKHQLLLPKLGIEL